MAQRSMYRAIETAQTTGCAGGPALLQKARGAYGNYWMHKKKEDEEDKDSWHGGTILLLKKCNSCKEVQAKVGVCRICEACVRNPLRFKKEATKKRKGGYAFTVNKGNVTQLFPEKAKKERAAA